MYIIEEIKIEKKEEIELVFTNWINRVWSWYPATTVQRYVVVYEKKKTIERFSYLENVKRHHSEYKIWQMCNTFGLHDDRPIVAVIERDSRIIPIQELW